jgi:predicted  nucleic acid-binding Zn-ribbon protein
MNAAVLGALVGLARIDRQRREARDRLAAMPGRKARIAEAESRLRAEVAGLDGELEETEKQRRTREQEIAGFDERIARDAGCLNAIRNNTEYQAMLKQIAETKTRQTTLENEVLELMEREEELGRRIRSDRARVDSELAALDGERGILEQEEERQRTALAELEAERGRLLGELEPELRARYERLAGAKHGLAVVAVVKGACGGCFSSLPPQRVNEVRLVQRLVLCDACSRILIWDEESSSQ